MTKRKAICCIDGDLLVFKAAASNEERSIKALHKPSGREKVFKHRTALKEFLDGKDFPLSDFEITDVQDAGPISHALQIAKQIINNILKACGTDRYEIYLSGEDNFRDTLPLPTKYKGNRDGMMKPLQIADVRGYLIDRHKAVVVNGREADDQISIRQWDGVKTGQKIIGCSTDKDSMGTEGWVFNWDKMKEPILIKGLGDLYLDDKGKVRGQGNKWKYLQWIVGDSIDGLNPTHLAGLKYGEKSAFNLLSGLQTEKECWKAVHDLYLSWYPDKVEYTDQNGNNVVADYLDIAQVYWDAIHMLRWEDDKVGIRNVMVKLGILHEE